MMELKLFIRSVVVLVLFASYCYAGSSRFSGSHENEHLKRLNKPLVKSIKSPDGDIIDCVHILHQPAFDHPLLKNHTIKMKPTSNPMWKNVNIKISSTMNASSSLEKHKAVRQLWHLNGKCPKGTIPIRRTLKEDALRANAVKRSLRNKKTNSTLAQPNSINPDKQDPKLHEYAVASVRGGEFYGGKATLNLWNPRVQNPNEFSLAQIWVVGESALSDYQLLDVNTIEVGWQVFPGLYGDSHTRLFIYWTSDSYQQTGGFNLNAAGFIQTSNKIAIGGTISPTSEMLGAQYDVTISVWKDYNDGNWWMAYDGEVVGYWPPTLFTYLQQSAVRVDFGGEVINFATDGQHTTTHMGSGEFAQQQYKVASYIKNIQIVDRSDALWNPTSIVPSTPKPNCYTIFTGADDNWGAYFYYGGPGRNPNCP